MSKYSKDDIIRMAEEEDVEFIRLQFTDIFGMLKNVAITSSQLDKALDNWINVKGLRPVTVGELMQLSGRDFPPLPDYGD